MGKKKGGKKGGKKKGDDGGAAEEPVQSQLAKVRELVLLEEREAWVTLRMNLMNWEFMNFTLRVKLSSHLFSIKQELVRRHGLIKELKICKGMFAERNELVGDTQTLAQLGFKGLPESEPEMFQDIHYTFKPCDHDDPLLLVWK